MVAGGIQCSYPCRSLPHHWKGRAHSGALACCRQHKVSCHLLVAGSRHCTEEMDYVVYTRSIKKHLDHPDHPKAVSDAVRQRAHRVRFRRPVPYAECWDCSILSFLPILEPDVTVLYVFRDQHTTNEDNREAQPIFPTVACIIVDLYSYWSQLESVIGHLQLAYAKECPLKQAQCSGTPMQG